MTDRTSRRLLQCLIVGLLGLPVAYVLSFGPMCWFVSWSGCGCRFVSDAYRPILRAGVDGPPAVIKVLHVYANLGVNRSARHTAAAAINLSHEYELEVCDPTDHVLIAPGYRRPDWRSPQR